PPGDLLRPCVRVCPCVCRPPKPSIICHRVTSTQTARTQCERDHKTSGRCLTLARRRPACGVVLHALDARLMSLGPVLTAALPLRTYGPRMDPDDGRVVTSFIAQALTHRPVTVYGDGTQTRSLQYVDDLVQGIVRFMGVEWTTPMNLGNPEETE